MPLTFIKIERQKNWRIGVIFVVLLFIYFVILMALWASWPESLLADDFLFKPRTISTIFIASLVVALIHFCFSTLDVVSSIRDNLHAVEPDPKDEIHRRLINIMQELQVVTGNKRKIGYVVIPIPAMNALATVDFRGNAMIAITEGLLSRLTRPQLEAVMAHEAYHILSGDCLETTVAASLFGLPAAVMEKFRAASGGRAFLSPAFLLAWLLLKLSRLLNFFISREREYRADAGAVRMTRDPLALAEALYRLSRSWRGVGWIADGLEMLCIVNPTAKAMDESEGPLADLLSTHPPIQKRVEALSKMAHVRISELASKTRPRAQAEASGPPESAFYALDPKHQWQGPFALSELSSLPWISPLTWISVQGAEPERAWRNSLIEIAIFKGRLSREEKRLTEFLCPSCQQPLLETPYENTQVYQCYFCSGVLVENAKMPRIIIRDEQPLTERIKSLSKSVIKENQLRRIERFSRDIHQKAIPHRSCPKCKNPMLRTFYSLAYLVEIDRCSFCGLTWFDQDELEMLQCMVANKMASEPLEPATRH